MKLKWGLSIEKNKEGVDFRYFRKCRHFENILFELGAVDYSWLPIFVLIRFWEIRKFLTNGLRESPCICILILDVSRFQKLKNVILYKK
jgi:hypothetical protein